MSVKGLIYLYYLGFNGSEVMMAADEGYDFLKLFPAVAVGGVNLLRGFAGPFANIQFCPTGGIKVETAIDFLSLPNVPVVGYLVDTK